MGHAHLAATAQFISDTLGSLLADIISNPALVDLFGKVGGNIHADVNGLLTSDASRGINGVEGHLLPHPLPTVPFILKVVEEL